MDSVTLSDLLTRCQAATILTVFQDRELSLYTDDYAKDRRVCIRVPSHRKYAEVTLLSGYNADKHCWEHSGVSRTVEIPNKRGEKKLDAWTDSINTKFTGYPRPKIAIYYRRENGELRP